MSSDPVKSIKDLVEKIRLRDEEHKRRLAEDPEYRAGWEAKEAARLEEERRFAESQKKFESDRLNDRRRELWIPQRIWPLLAAPEVTPALEAVRAFVVGPKTFLILAGGVGTGKTVAAAVVCDPGSPLPGRPGCGRLVKALDLARAGLFGEESEIWDVCRSEKLLAIDDLGTEPKDPKGYYLASLFALLDHRYDWERKTILTTNLSAEDFKATYCVGPGLRFLDRMREAGEFVNIAGKSMRSAP